MIPPIILRYLPHLIALVAIIGGVWYFGHTRYNAGQEAVRAEFREALARQGRTNDRVSKSVLEGYRHEIESIRNRPARVVRLCSAKSGLPATGDAGGIAGSGPTGGELSAGAGPDIGPSLYSEAARADALAAQLRAVQKWYGGVSGQ